MTEFTTKEEAGEALEALAQTKRRQEYQDLYCLTQIRLRPLSAWWSCVAG